MEPLPSSPKFNRTPKDAREFRERGWLGKIMIVGANFLAGPLVLGLSGRWLDHKTGHEYRYLITGVVLGLVWAFYEAFKIAWYINKEDRKIPRMDRKTSLFILLAHLGTLIPCLVISQKMALPADHFPVLLGWMVAAFNFTLAIAINMAALKRNFETFKLTVFAGSGIRMGLMLMLLFFVVKYKPLWTTPFSYSLLSCFGIYIVLEVGLFFIKSKHIR